MEDIDDDAPASAGDDADCVEISVTKHTDDTAMGWLGRGGGGRIPIKVGMIHSKFTVYG